MSVLTGRKGPPGHYCPSRSSLQAPDVDLLVAGKEPQCGLGLSYSLLLILVSLSPSLDQGKIKGV